MTVATKTKEAKKHQDSPEAGLLQAGPAKPGYGVRSYLHEFYDWRALDLGGDGDGWYLVPPVSAARRRLINAFRLMTVFGLLLLVIGAILILVGYMWPKTPLEQLFEDGIDDNNVPDGSVYFRKDKLNLLIEDKMRLWKLAGLVIFASGGLSLAISLLVPTCARLLGHSGLSSDLNTPAEPPVKIFPPGPPTSGDSAAATNVKPTVGLTSKSVPAVEAVTAVQPTLAVLKERRTSGDELLVMEDEQGR